MTTRLALLALVLLPACLDVTTTSDTHSPQPGSGGGSDSDPDGDSTGEGSSGQPLGGTGVASGGATGGEDGTSDSGSGSDSDGGTDTGGPASECILPTDGSWCAAQREVAQAIGCRTAPSPEHCYRTIVAQYTVGDWAVLAAGDCSTANDGPECAPLYSACTNAIGPAECALVDPATCQILAQMAGLEWALSKTTCVAMLAVYG